MTRIFSTSLLLLTVTLTCTHAWAQNYAVSSFNGELSALATKIDGPDADLMIYAASVNGNIPLVGYLGLNLYVTRGQGKVESTSFVFSNYSYDYLRYAVSPFVRDPKLGLLGLSVGRAEFEFDYDYNLPYSASKIKEDYWSILAAGYLGPLTLSATATRTQVVDSINSDQDYVWIDAVWYPIPDFLIDITAGFKEAKNDYTIAFEHQPSSISPHLSYGVGYSWDSDNYSKAILLTVAYRFAEKKSLMRRYREDLFGPR